MSKYYFFTDPELLDSQVAGQAFGPAGTSGSKDQFRITDLHSRKSGSSAAVPAFAVCDGLICAQAADNDTLSLILKPTEQPPFDFPFVSYFIYKGIDPTSLLVDGDAGPGGTIDTKNADVNQLVDLVQKSWAASNPDKDPLMPKRECLGLHLNPTDHPVVTERPTFAETEPLDRLFYQGDPNFQLPLVRGRWRIGDFASSRFGLDIIVERVGQRPRMGLARVLDKIIPVDPAGATDAARFQHWHAKEECLDYVDPCAFWGSFFPRTLRVWNGASNRFERKTGGDIYSAVLLGPSTVDQPGTDGNFFNRNCAHLDIRNEHGHSINYYYPEADRQKILLSLDATKHAIDDSAVDYYKDGWPGRNVGTGWPSFAIDNSRLPAGITGDHVDVRFALPKTKTTSPLIYVAAGYRSRFRGLLWHLFRRLKGPQRFIDRQRRADPSDYLDEATIAIPLVQSAGVSKVAASYQKLYHFKRPLIVDGQPAGSATEGLGPPAPTAFEHLFPFPGSKIFPRESGRTRIKTYADVFLVNRPSDDSLAFAARPGFARDSHNAYLFLIPVAHYLVPSLKKTEAPGGRKIPPFRDLAIDHFMPTYMEGLKIHLAQQVVHPIESAHTAPGLEVSVIYERSQWFSWLSRPGSLSDFSAAVLTPTEYELATVPQAISGTCLLTISPVASWLDAQHVPYGEAIATLSFLQPDAASAAIVRASHSNLPTLYFDENIQHR